MFPQLLKLLLLEFLLLEVSFLWFTSILYLDSLRIEHPVQSLYNTSFNRLKLFAKTECLSFFCYKIGIGLLPVIVHIISLDKLIINFARLINGYFHFRTLCRLKHIISINRVGVITTRRSLTTSDISCCSCLENCS